MDVLSEAITHSYLNDLRQIETTLPESVSVVYETTTFLTFGGTMEAVFDLNILEDETPLSALYILILKKLVWMLRLFWIPDEASKIVLIGSLYNPTNPLLLMSAIGLTIVKKYDFQSCLENYILGLDPHLEKHLMRVPTFDTEQEIDDFLTIETNFVQALYLLSLQLMHPATTNIISDLFPCAVAQLGMHLGESEKILNGLDERRVLTLSPLLPPLKDAPLPSAATYAPLLKFLALPQLMLRHQNSDAQNILGSPLSTPLPDRLWPDPTPSLAESWEQLKQSDTMREWHFDRFTVLYYAWIILNPMYLVMSMGDPAIPEVTEAQSQPALFPFERLRRYGYSINSAVHHMREYYHHELQSIHSLYNDILEKDVPKSEKKAQLTEMKARRTRASMLVSRAYRMYQWLPHEIRAHQEEERFLRWSLEQYADPLPEVEDRFHYFQQYGE